MFFLADGSFPSIAVAFGLTQQATHAYFRGRFGRERLRAWRQRLSKEHTKLRARRVDQRRRRARERGEPVDLIPPTDPAFWYYHVVPLGAAVRIAASSMYADGYRRDLRGAETLPLLIARAEAWAESFARRDADALSQIAHAMWGGLFDDQTRPPRRALMTGDL